VAAIYFKSAGDFRKWLEKNHAAAPELLVGFHKRGSSEPSLTWPESVDQALCFGWIDGVRRRVDDRRYTIRFTPRRPKSIWSAVNIARVQELDARGLMRPPGRAAFEARTEKKSAVYAYEQAEAALDPASTRAFRKNKPAWAFFAAQPPWYRKKASYWVTNAKKPETRASRLARLIAVSAKGERA
jgi:uncharacterized protein YdeI (YjbR/CyaY-like superfamily)